MLEQLAPSQPKFELVVTAGGEISIRNNIVNEIMHNPVGPWAEANLLYIQASRLKERLQGEQDTSEQVPLVLFDVGLGAAANALAAVAAAESARNQIPQRPLHIVSFENDLSLLDFVIEHADEIPYTRGKKRLLTQLRADYSWQSDDGMIRWDLIEGDFLETATTVDVCPEIVFYDPYSPLSNQEMWSKDAFTLLHSNRVEGSRPTTLFTYSRATPIRTAMLAAGFFVGQGPRSGLKHETTQASTDPRQLDECLGERWLIKWLRSHTKYGLGAASQLKSALADAVLRHPQFSDYVWHALVGWKNQSAAEISPTNPLS